MFSFFSPLKRARPCTPESDGGNEVDESAARLKRLRLKQATTVETSAAQVSASTGVAGNEDADDSMDVDPDESGDISGEVDEEAASDVEVDEDEAISDAELDEDEVVDGDEEADGDEDVDDVEDGGDEPGNDSTGSIQLSREERVRKLLEEYEELKAGIEGSDRWSEEQAKVHKLIFMRGEEPMMACTWKFNFLMWEVQPEVYSEQLTDDKMPISAMSSEFHAGKALEALFDLTLQVKCWIDLDEHDKIPRTIIKGLKQYIKWAKQDAGVLKKDFPPVIIVRAYPLDFAIERTVIKEEENSGIMDELPPAMGENNGVNDVPADGTGNVKAEEESEVTGVAAVSQDIESRLRDIAYRQRLLYKEKSREIQAEVTPPVLYAFAVVAHVALLVSLDPATEDAPLITLDTIHFNHVDQWLWNALSIALPVNMARDSMYERRDLWGLRASVLAEIDVDL